jgi:hypothetical protein
VASSAFTFWALNISIEGIAADTYFLNALFASMVVMTIGYQTGMLHPIARTYIGIGSFYKVALLVSCFSILHFSILYLLFGLNISPAFRGLIIEGMSSGLILLILKSFNRGLFKKKNSSTFLTKFIITTETGM